MMAFCSSKVYYLESEHVQSEVVQSEVIPFLKIMAFSSVEVCNLDSEHALSEVVPILKDDGFLLVRRFLPGE
jgi:hypothetical protein